MSPFSLRIKIGWATSASVSLDLSLPFKSTTLTAGAKSKAMAVSPRAAANDDIEPTDMDN